MKAEGLMYLMESIKFTSSNKAGLWNMCYIIITLFRLFYATRIFSLKLITSFSSKNCTFSEHVLSYCEEKQMPTNLRIIDCSLHIINLKKLHEFTFRSIPCNKQQYRGSYISTTECFDRVSLLTPENSYRSVNLI